MPDSTNPNLQFREDLTEYGLAVLNDYEGTLNEIKDIAPVIPTGVLAGRYPTFNNKNDFAIVNTKRAPGGDTPMARFGGTMTDFVLENNALKMPIDQEIEIPLAGGNAPVLERAKLHSLLAQSVQSLALDVYTILKAGVTKHATFGKWGDAAVDPIDQLDAAAEEIYTATGMYPTACRMTPTMWRRMKNNPMVVKRFPGKTKTLSREEIGAEVGDGSMSFRMVKGAGLVSGNFGNENATFAPFLGTSAWLYYASPLAAGLTPNFAAILARENELLGGVYEYTNDDGTLRYLRVRWDVKAVVQSTALVRRIDFAA